MTENQVRVFVASAVALSVPAWNTAFNLGVFGTVFFETVFFVWVASTATLAATLVVPKGSIPISWTGRFLMLLPTLVVLHRLVNDQAILGDLSSRTEIGLAIVIVVLSLPYTLYAVVFSANPDLLKLRSKRLQFGLVAIIIGVGLAGFAVGHQNQLFLSCWDFQVSGNDLPARCL